MRQLHVIVFAAALVTVSCTGDLPVSSDVTSERSPSFDFPSSITLAVDWSQSTSGPRRWDPGLAFLPAPTCKALSFGGLFAGSNSGETLLFDPTLGIWSTLSFSPSNQPTPRRAAGLNWDSSRNRAILFGGLSNGGSFLADTWAFDRTKMSWTALIKTCKGRTVCPPARGNHGQAYSSVLGGTLVFGGTTGSTHFNDSWIFGSAGWARLVTIGSPSARHNFGMAVDAPSGKVVLYGGKGANGTQLSDTWLLDPASLTWTQVAAAGPVPAARHGMAMSFAPPLGAVVLHSGLDASNQETNETWAFDMGELKWVQIATTTSPPPRSEARLTTNSCNGTNILFGTPGAITGSPPPASENYTWIFG